MPNYSLSALFSSSPVFVHDLFNIVVLSFIIPLSLSFLWLTTDMTKMATPLLGEGHFGLFTIIWCTFLLYMIVDCVWVFVVPGCTKTNPWEIIWHHILVIIFCSLSYFEPQLAWHQCMLLLAEINTMFLLLRRNIDYKGISFKLINFLFYITWVLLRLILFPCLLIFFCFEFERFSKKRGTYFHFFIIGPILTVLLTFLSYYWTYEMLFKLKKIKQ